jgi:hypothetical protein
MRVDERVDWILPRDSENSYQLSLKFEPVQSQSELMRIEKREFA